MAKSFDIKLTKKITLRHFKSPKFQTHYSILDAKAQLISKVWSTDQNHGHGGTPDNVQLDPGLGLESLRVRKSHVIPEPINPRYRNRERK